MTASQPTTSYTRWAHAGTEAQKLFHIKSTGQLSLSSLPSTASLSPPNSGHTHANRRQVQPPTPRPPTITNSSILMLLHLTNSKKVPILKALFQLNSQHTHNAQPFHSSAAKGAAATLTNMATQIRGLQQRQRGLQRQLLHGSSLPLSRLLHSSTRHRLCFPYLQVSFVLPHPTSLYPLQEILPLAPPDPGPPSISRPLTFANCYRSPLKILRYYSLAKEDSGPDAESDHIHRILKLGLPRARPFFPSPSVFGSVDLNSPKILHLKCRGYCSGVKEDSDSDAESECVDSSESVKSRADSKEVERVCKVIDELFALDRNMEAVLDECGINLTHDLVVDVLERFKHARKPAFRFFCWAANRPGFAHDSRTYNKMMQILGNTRQFETMVSVLEEMGDKGLLTMETFEISIKAFAAAKERKKAVGLFELMKKYKFKVGVETINCLLDELGKAKLGKEAQALFEKLEFRFTPNLKTYTVLLNGWCRVKNLMEAGKVWNAMIDNGFKPDIVAHNTMLDGLLRCKKRSDAIKLFEVMKAKGPSLNVRSYTILITDLCKQGKMSEAIDYLDEMLSSGCEPDAAIYTCLIKGYGNQKKMDKVYGLLMEMKEKGCPPDAQLYNALIKLMTNRQMPDDAVRIYKKMIQSGIQPTIHTYNMMMRSFFMTRNCDMGCAVWEEMNKKGCCPDENSYTVLIGGLIRQGRSIEACKYLEEMIEKGMKAPQLDYNKFAADFSRAGKPDILEELAQRMKFSGKFEVSNVFGRWAEMMKKRVKRRDHVRAGDLWG